MGVRGGTGKGRLDEAIDDRDEEMLFKATGEPMETKKKLLTGWSVIVNMRRKENDAKLRSRGLARLYGASIWPPVCGTPRVMEQLGRISSQPREPVNPQGLSGRMQP